MNVVNKKKPGWRSDTRVTSRIQIDDVWTSDKRSMRHGPEAYNMSRQHLGQISQRRLWGSTGPRFHQFRRHPIPSFSRSINLCPPQSRRSLGWNPYGIKYRTYAVLLTYHSIYEDRDKHHDQISELNSSPLTMQTPPTCHLLLHLLAWCWQNRVNMSVFVELCR